MGFWHGMAGVEDQQLQYVVGDISVSSTKISKSLETVVNTDKSTPTPTTSARVQNTTDPHFVVTNINTSTGQAACSEFAKVVDIHREVGFAVVMTTYKGHQIIKHTLSTWKAAGVFSHQSYRETVIHVNACTEDDIDVLRILFEGVQSVKVLCNSGNRIWTVAFYNALSSTTSSSILFSENDRPIQRLAGETQQQQQIRVRTYLTKAVEIISTHESPFISLKKFVSKEDEDIFIKNNSLSVENDTHDATGVNCWSNCLSRIADSKKSGEDNTHVQCKKILSKIETVLTPECEIWTCKELASFQTGTGWGSMCYPAMLRNFKQTREFAATVVSQHAFSYPYSDQYSANTTRIACLKVNWWNNEPALYRFSWVKELFSFACLSYRTRVDSGLTFLAHKPWFGRYGRRFETFLTNYVIAKGAMPHCYGDGLFTHREPISYDRTHAAG